MRFWNFEEDMKEVAGLLPNKFLILNLYVFHILGSSTTAFFLFLQSGKNVINPQQQTCRFNGCLEHLLLNIQRLQNPKLTHILDFACITINPPELSFWILTGMFSSKLCNNTYNISSTVLG
jgi:hypothetical protein